MATLQVWDEKTSKKQLTQRLRDANTERREQEQLWEQNERTVYNTSGAAQSNNMSSLVESDNSVADGASQGSGSVGINYAFKNLRFIHAQLSANPPSVVPRPTSNDLDDRRKADAADRLIRYALREHSMQEVVDKASLNALVYGTGFTKTLWDNQAGDILEVDEETGEMVMEGEFSITIPNVWDIFIDPDATSWDQVNFIFEKKIYTWEEATFRWSDKLEILEKFRIKSGTRRTETGAGRSIFKSPNYDVVELYEYWEKGTPMNGYLGRYCICTSEGDLVTEMMQNPEAYAPARKHKKDNRPRHPIARLPYQIFTDIDVPGRIWGKSVIEFEVGLQDSLNRIDSVTLENMQAHGVARIILPEGAEIADDSITNSPWDIIKITGSQPIHYMEPMPTPPIIPMLMDRYKVGIDDMAGVNESMFGQQSREQSGFSMQYATNQGNMIRRRLFNKYVLFVEEIYKSFLRVVQKNWEIPRTVQVLGKEKAFEAMDIKGADIDGGFDLVVEYGASLSLDPTTRREEILTLMPLFEKAGVDSRQILQMLKLNELGGMYDIIELAKDRQQEIFEEMTATGLYISPEELQDHKNMLTYCYYYVMTTEFKYLDEDSKTLIKKHVKDREAVLAETAGAPALGGQPPGPEPQGVGGGASPGGAPDLAGLMGGLLGG